jgi:hypothetical protein
VPVLDYAQETKRKRWPFLAAGVAFLLLWLGFAYWKQLRPPNIPCRTRILAVDALTHAKLNPGVGGPPIRDHDPWHMTFASIPDAEGIEVGWIYTDKPCPIRVKVDGYQEVEILLTPDSPRAITVHLQAINVHSLR